MSRRFGNVSNHSINSIILENTPINTTKSKNYVWKAFQDFCLARKYELNGEKSLNELATILKDYAVNMRKIDGTEYKEASVKTIWNITSKLLQEKYFNEYKIVFDPFASVIFKNARDARDATRKRLQKDPTKQKCSSASLSLIDLTKIIKIWDENTPHGLQRKMYHIIAVELAWRGGEATNCLIDYFNIEKNNDGTLTNRIEYNPIFSKTCQGGSKSCTNSKWLVPNVVNKDACPVRLFNKLISKRGKNITSNRLFLRPNRFWKTENDTWFDNIPVGKNTINGWTKSSAQVIGLDTKNKKITNHSNRSTAVSQLAKKGVPEQQLIKITGHNNSTSIKPYLTIDENRHDEIINSMRGNASTVGSNNTSSSSASTFNFTNCTFNNCSFNK